MGKQPKCGLEKINIMRILEVVLFIVGILMSVAYLTVAERKTLGYMQRRLGPNAVGKEPM